VLASTTSCARSRASSLARKRAPCVVPAGHVRRGEPRSRHPPARPAAARGWTHDGAAGAAPCVGLRLPGDVESRSSRQRIAPVLVPATTVVPSLDVASAVTSSQDQMAEGQTSDEEKSFLWGPGPDGSVPPSGDDDSRPPSDGDPHGPPSPGEGLDAVIPSDVPQLDVLAAWNGQQVGATTSTDIYWQRSHSRHASVVPVSLSLTDPVAFDTLGCACGATDARRSCIRNVPTIVMVL
jgi:hypothetical protein